MSIRQGLPCAGVKNDTVKKYRSRLLGTGLRELQNEEEKEWQECR
jgi:hypothetical protein